MLSKRNSDKSLRLLEMMAITSVDGNKIRELLKNAKQFSMLLI